jgi:hypothetical protein
MKTLTADFKYYLPRWLIFGVIAGAILGGPVVSPNADGTMPESYYWHVILWQRLPLGVAYGLLSGVAFVFLQRMWNMSGSRLKWWVNVLGSTIAARLVLLGLMSLAQQASPQSQNMGKIEADAKKDFPNLTYSEAVQQESVKKQKQSLAAMNSETERNQSAAGSFLGFYFMSARVRFDYCKDLGVDISSFVNGFKRVNKDSYDRAKIVLAHTTFTEEQLFAQLKPQLEGFNEKNMADVASTQKMTTLQLCEQIRADPDPKVAQLVFSKVSPPTYEILSHVQ